MRDPRAFLTIERRPPARRPPAERMGDYRDVELRPAETELRDQAARCMGCGVPFCHTGCPLENLVPDWNDLARAGRWEDAAERLHRTNNFPEFTGALCPAPCEAACVLSLAEAPVTIKAIERAIADRAWDAGGVAPRPPARESGRRVAVVGSGPAGLAAAQQLRRAGHAVTVFERDDRPGGLLRYGIPDYKLDRAVLDRRIGQLEAEGVRFRCGVDVGRDADPAALRAGHDAVVVCVGAQRPRELPVPGRSLAGVHTAMEYLVQQNRRVAGLPPLPGPAISAAGRRVAIVGSGDTAADCLGNAHREGAAAVVELAHGPEPPASAPAAAAWPDRPWTLRRHAPHEEGGMRDWLVETAAFTGDGRVERLHAGRLDPARRPIPGAALTLDVDLVLIAVGFTGPDADAALDGLAVARGPGGLVAADRDGATAAAGVFAAGDCVLGADLVVTAIAEGRRAAGAADRYLAGLGVTAAGAAGRAA